ncbi:hypothetical protein SN15_05780 [Stenotrophomonas maltophilia]|nr:hypothetical protein SN15_05780 [Stenotrophomonas maltophilia]
MGKEAKKSSAQLDIGSEAWKAAIAREEVETIYLAEVRKKVAGEEEEKEAARAAAASKKGMDGSLEDIVDSKPETKKRRIFL